MTSNAVKRFMERRQKKRECFFERFHKDFEGKVFEVITSRRSLLDGSIGVQLCFFDNVTGLTIDPDIDVWPIPKVTRVEIGERVISTGKIVATPTLKEDFIFAIEVLTTRGIGYIHRFNLLGPMVKQQDGTIKVRGQLETRTPKE